MTSELMSHTNLSSFQPQVKQDKIFRNASKKVSSGSECILVFFPFMAESLSSLLTRVILRPSAP